MGGLDGEVVALVGILVEIVKLFEVGDEGADVFEVFLANEDAVGHLLVHGLFAVEVGEDVGAEFLAGGEHHGGVGPGGFGVFEERRKVVAADVPGGGEAGELEDGGGDIDAADGDVADGVFGDCAGHGEDEGRADFDAAEAVLAEGEALVGGEDDEGVFDLFSFFEGGHEAADGFIEAVDALVILTDPLGEGLAAGDGGFSSTG